MTVYRSNSKPTSQPLKGVLRRERRSCPELTTNRAKGRNIFSTQDRLEQPHISGIDLARLSGDANINPLRTIDGELRID